MTKKTKTPTLKFNKKKHTYEYDGKQLQSVTTWVKSFFPKFDEKKLAKYVALARTRKGQKTTMRDVLKEWKQVAMNGTMVHQDIEDYFKNEVADVGLLSTRALQAIEWYQLYPWSFPEASPEVRLYDTEIGLAGTCDMIVAQPDETITLIDWKTNKAIKKDGYEPATHPCVKDLPNANYYHYMLQLSTYAYMLERQGRKINKLILVHLTNDGAVPYEVPYDKERVMKMIEWSKKHGKTTKQ